MAEEKTYVFGEGAGNGILGLLGPMLSQRGVDPNVLLAMQGRNNDGFGEGGWFIWVIFLFFLIGWGGNGFGNNGAGGLGNQLNNDYGREMLLQAINGNGNAISQLATTLNCDINAVQSAINSVQSQIQSVGNQVGMSGQQIINAIQAGNCQIASQIASCCCDVRTAIERQGYEGHLAMHISSALKIKPYGEEYQYLTGEIGQSMFKIAKRFLCDDCRQKLVIEIKEIDKKD